MGTGVAATFDAVNAGPLRVARWKPATHVLGPGRRAVVWFHGCSRDCPGCIAREMNDADDFQSVCPEELVQRIKSVPAIQGITLTGGEPFEQPLLSLLSLLRILRESTALSVMCYSGYTLDQLKSGFQGPLRQRILEYVDLLVDGPYRQLENRGQRWRGSSNQQFHFLSSRYRSLAVDLADSVDRAVEIDLSRDGTLALTGIPEDGFLDRLAVRMRERGVVVDFSGGR